MFSLSFALVIKGMINSIYFKGKICIIY